MGKDLGKEIGMDGLRMLSERPIIFMKLWSYPKKERPGR
jgi:hypothetical protein